MLLASAAHAYLCRASRGRLAGRVAHRPFLLLTTVGRHSGRSRTTPPQHVDDGSAVVVVASTAGRPLAPAWRLNLRDHPGCEVQIRGRRFHARSSAAAGAERDRRWRLVSADNRGYARAQATHSSRTFPVVILDPQESR